MQNVTENSTITLTISFTLLLTCMIVVGHTEPIHADHGTLPTFQTGDPKYRCQNNLENLNYERIVPCTEFGKAASTWSDAVSNLNITSSNSNREIIVYATEHMDEAIGNMIPFPATGDLKKAFISFSTKHKWGDNTYWLHLLSRYDFQTTALHELGHVLGLNHDRNSDLMQSETAP